MKPNVLCSHLQPVEYWLSNPHPSENTGWRRYIFIFSPFNQLDKYWPTLALKCSNLYFGGYAVVFGKQDDRVKLCRVYSISLKMSNVGKFPWS